MKHAIVTLDETGSMRGQQHRVVTSLNEYVDQLPRKTRLTVFKFDSERWTTFFRGKVKKWKAHEGDGLPPWSDDAPVRRHRQVHRSRRVGRFQGRQGHGHDRHRTATRTLPVSILWRAALPSCPRKRRPGGSSCSCRPRLTRNGRPSSERPARHLECGSTPAPHTPGALSTIPKLRFKRGPTLANRFWTGSRKRKKAEEASPFFSPNETKTIN